ncbi:proline iminopeptidase [Rhizobium sp. NFR07]|uniref:alpha/beta fold hydrolase n=1 Tax=Rhizobium sp. NFR07 TaxID=1566262 RepID=UPI0008DF5245|nr:alpha/beta hydrolase [Rhizobium sp. NFR07]SFB58394.1 proline iminopeptidase [Rhizobium sp. NFR07]
MLHGGLGSDHGYLRPGLGPLGDVARIVYVDLRGQGRSGRPPLETCSLEQMADDIVDLSVMLGIEKPVIFGHSAGGFVAMIAAFRHPDLIGGVILCETLATLEKTETADSVTDPRLSDRAPAEVVAAAERYFTTPVTAETGEAFVRLVHPFYAAPHYMASVDKLYSLSSFTPELHRHFRENIAPTYDVRDELGGITCPALVLVGGYDWICPPSAGRDIARRIRGAELVEFTNSGHFLFSEEPQTFQAIVSKFLKGTADAFEGGMR